MAKIKINDGVVTYEAECPDDWNCPPNWAELKASFADGYDTGDGAKCTPFKCTVSGDFDGSFLLHCNGRGGTIEADEPLMPVTKIQWD